MKRVPLSKASMSVAQFVEDMSDDGVVFTSGRRSVAMLFPLPASEALEVEIRRVDPRLWANPRFRAIIEKSRAEYAAGKWYTHEEVFADLDREKPARRTRRPATTAPASGRKRSAKAVAKGNGV